MGKRCHLGVGEENADAARDCSGSRDWYLPLGEKCIVGRLRSAPKLCWPLCIHFFLSSGFTALLFLLFEYDEGDAPFSTTVRYFPNRISLLWVSTAFCARGAPLAGNITSVDIQRACDLHLDILLSSLLCRSGICS